MEFFDDAPTSISSDTAQPPPDTTGSGRPPRQRRDRRRMRIQRLVVGVALLFVIIFVVAWGVRSCAQSRKVESYREYMAAVNGAVADSAKLGKELDRVVGDPTALTRKKLIAKLDEMVAAQAEIAARTRTFEPPRQLEDQQDALRTGMQVRAQGFALFRDAMLAVLDKKKGVDATDISRLAPYFSGPDAYYRMLFYAPSRRVMSDEGVSGVEVPVSDYYVRTRAFDRARLESMIKQLGASAKTTGIHGVALAGVTAEPSGTALQRGRTVKVPADPALAFRVKVQNQGSVAERDVPVKVTLTVEGASPVSAEASIAVINAGQTQSVDVTGLAISEQAITQGATLKVMVGPVAEERVQSNNRGEFKFMLQL